MQIVVKKYADGWSAKDANGYLFALGDTISEATKKLIEKILRNDWRMVHGSGK